MWRRYRLIKHAVAPLLLAVAYGIMRELPEDSPWRVAGLVLAVAVGGAYVIEEVVWALRGSGRPCPRCGRPVRIKSFRVLLTCPHCGENFD